MHLKWLVLKDQDAPAETRNKIPSRHRAFDPHSNPDTVRPRERRILVPVNPLGDGTVQALYLDDSVILVK